MSIPSLLHGSSSRCHTSSHRLRVELMLIVLFQFVVISIFEAGFGFWKVKRNHSVNVCTMLFVECRKSCSCGHYDRIQWKIQGLWYSVVWDLWGCRSCNKYPLNLQMWIAVNNVHICYFKKHPTRWKVFCFSVEWNYMYILYQPKSPEWVGEGTSKVKLTFEVQTSFKTSYFPWEMLTYEASSPLSGLGITIFFLSLGSNIFCCSVTAAVAE